MRWNLWHRWSVQLLVRIKHLCKFPALLQTSAPLCTRFITARLQIAPRTATSTQANLAKSRQRIGWVPSTRRRSQCLVQLPTSAATRHHSSKAIISEAMQGAVQDAWLAFATDPVSGLDTCMAPENSFRQPGQAVGGKRQSSADRNRYSASRSLPKGLCGRGRIIGGNRSCAMTAGNRRVRQMMAPATLSTT